MKRKQLLRRARRGNVVVLSAVLMVAMMAMIAFAVDLGYLYNARTEMQRAADASAIAACWELIDEDVVRE
jgi:Flp pilus assembly protein TadG